MSGDDELERLKARRLAEMQANISRMEPGKGEAGRPKAPSHREVLIGRLGYRGEEVLRNAEVQFPAEARIVIDRLGQLLASGEVNEEIDGGKLLLLFRSVGLHVRMQTKISIEEDGKLVSLSEKLGKGGGHT